MGNCQAAEISAVVIQHPGGKIERLYWPTTAQDIMKSNPGHLVALCIFAPHNPSANDASDASIFPSHRPAARRKVRLLKPKDMLLIGQVYRLVTTQEVSNALKARNKIKESMEVERTKSSTTTTTATQPFVEMNQEDEQQQRDHRQRSAAAGARLRQWRPKLQSISEGLS